MADSTLKKMLKHTEIGGIKKTKAKTYKANRVGKQLKAKKNRYSTTDL